MVSGEGAGEQNEPAGSVSRDSNTALVSSFPMSFASGEHTAALSMSRGQLPPSCIHQTATKPKTEAGAASIQANGCHPMFSSPAGQAAW